MPLFAFVLWDWLSSRPLQDLADQLVPEVGGMLLLITAGVLIYRASRERYLLSWLAGMGAYSGLRVAAAIYERNPGNRQVAALGALAMGLTIGCFLLAVLLYTDRMRWFSSLAIAVAGVTLFSITHEIWSPTSVPVSMVTFLLWTALCLLGAAALALFSRGQSSLGPWLLTGVLILFPTESLNTLPMFAYAHYFTIGMLGLSMILMVVDDARMRNRRLVAINAITFSMAEAKDFGPIMNTALEVLRDITDARAAWFRLIDAGRLVMTNHIDASADYIRERGVLELDSSLTGDVIRRGRPAVLRGRDTETVTRERLRNDDFDHLLVIPVEGKGGPIGAITIAHSAYRTYRPAELEFLHATARQLGLALENLRLFDQIIYSQRQWVNTFDSIRDFILVHDENYRIIRVNRAFAARLNARPAEVAGRAVHDLLPYTTAEPVPCPYCERDRDTQATFAERPDPCFGGFSIVSSYSYSEDGSRRLGTIHIIQDTTERRLAEQRYKMLFDGVQEGAFISTPEGRLVDVNDAFVRMMGYSSRDEVLNLDDATCLYADPQQRVLFRREMEDRGYVRNYPVNLRRNDGTILIGMESSFATRAIDGSIERYQGFILDITDQKRAEDELRRRNRELAVLNSIATVATRSFDLDFILRETLTHLTQMFAADSSSVYLIGGDPPVFRRRAAVGHGDDPVDLTEFPLTPEMRNSTHDRVELLSEEQIAIMPHAFREFASARGIQSLMWCVLWSKDQPMGIIGISSRTAHRYSAQDQQLLLAVGRQLALTIEKVQLYDETARAYENLSRTQEQLLQSEKMSAVGQLISGVAHELNNPLTAILGYAQLLETDSLDDRTRDFVQKIHRQAQRTHRVVQNLLSFARQRKTQKMRVDLRRVVEDTLVLRDYDLKLNNIKVEREFGADVPDVVADAYQLEQVFLNIINNAVDAMLEHARGGTVRVRTFGENGSAVVEIRDSGPGIREPKRIFDPFYTTKQVGKGTGLGLSICYGIVKEHAGDIRAWNHSDGGAIFQVCLPAAVRPVKVAAERVLEPGAPMLKGRVLLVDDEDSVLEFESEVLTSAGAEVTAINQGDAAIAALQHSVFDAVILDGKMPGGWSGFDIYYWLRDNRPGLDGRVVFAMSNFDDPQLHMLIEQHHVPYLIKPFEVVDLIASVRRVLETKRPSAMSAG
jgi:PAS domain S-box-containing protein